MNDVTRIGAKGFAQAIEKNKCERDAFHAGAKIAYVHGLQLAILFPHEKEKF